MKKLFLSLFALALLLVPFAADASWTRYDSQGNQLVLAGPVTGVATVMNVKTDCGATGDGATDDTTKIQTCITAAVAGHGGRGVDLYFPEGIYYTSATLTVLGDNVRLIGAGRGSTVIYPNFASGDVIQFGNGTAQRNQQGMMHMQIFAPSARTSGVCVNIQYSNDFLLEDFALNNCVTGVQVGTPTNPSLKVHIRNGTINATLATTGVSILVLNGLGGDTYISDIVTSNSPASKPAAGIRITQAGHVSILRANITSSTIGLDVNPGASQDVNYLFIDHSLFDSGGTHGAKFAPTNATGRIRSVMSVNSWYAGSLVNYGIEIGGVASSTVDGLSFVGCRILNNYQHGVYISYAGATNINFTNSVISGNGQQTINTYDGINAIAAVNGVQIINSGIGARGTGTNQQRYAINVASGASNGWQIMGNDCTLNGTIGNMGYINFLGTGGNNVILGNNPQSMPQGAALTAATAGINTTETLVAPAYHIGANAMQAGTTLEIILQGTNTSTVANASTFRIQMGTAGTIADGAIATGAVTSAASGTAVPFSVRIVITCRTVGASGTFSATMEVFNNGTTGIAAAAITIVAMTMTAGNTTTDNYITATYQTAATTTTSTFQQGIISAIKY